MAAVLNNLYLQTFLLPWYTFTAGNTRHRIVSVFIQNPNGSAGKSQRRGTVSVFPLCLSAPERRESGSGLSKVCPQGTGRNFVEIGTLSFFQNFLTPLTGCNAFPPSQSRKVQKCLVWVTKCAVCCGFFNKSFCLLGFYNSRLPCNGRKSVLK